MIHFAYPSVQENNLVFCGRFVYLPSCPSEFNEDFQQVRIGNDRVSHLEDAQNAAEEFAPKSTENKSQIYECQENPKAYYMGNSLLLAYLLALINTCRKVKWEENSSELYDILCTGDINFKSDEPLLTDVDAAGFDRKLEYFLSEQCQEKLFQEKLFIVPDVNLQIAHENLCRNKGVEILSIDKFQDELSKSGYAVLGRKTVLAVKSKELGKLVDVIFSPTSGDCEEGCEVSVSKVDLHLHKCPTVREISTGKTSNKKCYTIFAVVVIVLLSTILWLALKPSHDDNFECIRVAGDNSEYQTSMTKPDDITVYIDEYELLVSSDIINKYAKTTSFSQNGQKRLSRREIEKLVKKFGLFDEIAPNFHLSFLGGDIAYWYEQELTEKRYKLEFVARRIILEAASQQNLVIGNQGKLSGASQQVMATIIRHYTD